MIVKDLVETRELLTDETNENVFVVYERFENVDCQCDGRNLEEIECDPEEMVQILLGNPESADSLKSVKTYQVGVVFSSVDAIIKDIYTNYRDYLKKDDVLVPLG
ncbi:hypothetical protein [Salipaludibacillus aurantiacus]|uniref:Uncharacterized protein n=1 Tax=Salipaludibacillus aurantiacus TaxID=1601833 RepID=A0A1H9PGY1_9BACI|nr:hypothetical protein [Salipaludibacillus aurantiacus]SER47414.1 hypothetical protein SAMN05518684_101310 [Salipaludibacillus aurantiacus]